MSDPTPPCPSRQGRLVCLFNAGHEIPCSFYDPTTAAPAPAADWTPATPPRRASPAEPEHRAPLTIEIDAPDATLGDLAAIANDLIAALRDNTAAHRTLASTLGQRAQQETTYPPVRVKAVNQQTVPRPR